MFFGKIVPALLVVERESAPTDFDYMSGSSFIIKLV